MLRPRKRSNNSQQAASSIYYLGYVEENESPASIMKKFEELERMQQKNDLPNDQPLSEDQMQELFKKTSAFSLESIIDDLYEFDDEFLFLDEDENSFPMEYLSNLDDQDCESVEQLTTSSSTEDSFPFKRQSRKQRLVFNDNINISLLLKNGKTRKGEQQSLLSTIRLPPVITNSFANVITDKRESNCPLYWWNQLSQTNKLPFVKELITAVMINLSNWQSFDKLVSIDTFIDQGFLLIWSRKQDIPKVVEFAHKYGFKYCESICWIKMNLQHKLHVQQSPYVNECKETLFVFRRFKDSEMHLKHQRNADCVFDFVKPEGSGAKPSAVYGIIDTLIIPRQCKLNEEVGNESTGLTGYEQISFIELADIGHKPIGISDRWCKIIF